MFPPSGMMAFCLDPIIASRRRRTSSPSAYQAYLAHEWSTAICRYWCCREKPHPCIVATMIDLYYCGTPNGLKMAIFMAETGLPHRVIPVNLSKGDQFKPEFLIVSPNNKIPAMIDHDPI